MLLSLIYAALYGVTMKVADLLNEHGLKWFKYSDILFGFLWGIFGSLLVLKTDPTVASVLVAMNIAFLVRNRLDYLNHQIAVALIVIAGIFYGQILIPQLLAFFIIFAIFGSLKDYADDVLHLRGFWGWFTESGWYYPIPTLIYCLYFGDWLVFWVLTTYIVAYDITRDIAKRYGYK